MRVLGRLSWGVKFCVCTLAFALSHLLLVSKCNGFFLYYT